MKNWGKNGKFSITFNMIFKLVKMPILKRKIPKSQVSLQRTVLLRKLTLSCYDTFFSSPENCRNHLPNHCINILDFDKRVFQHTSLCLSGIVNLLLDLEPNRQFSNQEFHPVLIWSILGEVWLFLIIELDTLSINCLKIEVLNISHYTSILRTRITDVFLDLM